MKSREPLLSGTGDAAFPSPNPVSIKPAIGTPFVKWFDEIGICGEAPSDYPEFAHFLVEQGIESISLNPDSVLKTTLALLEKEQS